MVQLYHFLVYVQHETWLISFIIEALEVIFRNISIFRDSLQKYF